MSSHFSVIGSRTSTEPSGVEHTAMLTSVQPPAMSAYSNQHRERQAEHNQQRMHKHKEEQQQHQQNKQEQQQE